MTATSSPSSSLTSSIQCHDHNQSRSPVGGSTLKRDRDRDRDLNECFGCDNSSVFHSRCRNSSRRRHLRDDPQASAVSPQTRPAAGRRAPPYPPSLVHPSALIARRSLLPTRDDSRPLIIAQRRVGPRTCTRPRRCWTGAPACAPAPACARSGMRARSE